MTPRVNFKLSATLTPSMVVAVGDLPESNRRRRRDVEDVRLELICIRLIVFCFNCHDKWTMIQQITFFLVTTTNVEIDFERVLTP